MNYIPTQQLKHQLDLFQARLAEVSREKRELEAKVEKLEKEKKELLTKLRDAEYLAVSDVVSFEELYEYY